MSTATLLTALNADVGAWFDEGDCVQEGADLFFARQGEPANGAREAQAKDRCAGCAVLADCLEWALAAGDPSGVWAGGTNTAERMALVSSYSIAS